VASIVDASPTLLDGEDIAAADLRRELSGAVFPSAGVVRGLRVAALATPDMVVKLPAGVCMVDDGGGGLIPLSLPADSNLDIAASSSTLPRLDSVIAEVLDTGDPATLLRHFRVLTGTPAASPTAPALPPADQLAARTLRIGNVFVQANAEVNGKIRPQDVTFVAPSATISPRPVITNFVTKPSFATDDQWVDFTSAQWPAATLTVPASGMLRVTVGVGNMSNSNSGNASTIRVAFRISGANTVSADPLDSKCVLNSGTDNVSMSRQFVVTGLTPGGTVTVTPQWRISSGSSSTVTLSSGQMLVDPVA
jgi:hypothetical protein